MCTTLTIDNIDGFEKDKILLSEFPCSKIPEQTAIWTLKITK